MLAASSAWAWPWTTPDECVRDYEALAQGKRSLMVIRVACDHKYGSSQTDAEAYEASCFLDRAHAYRLRSAGARGLLTRLLTGGN